MYSVVVTFRPAYTMDPRPIMVTFDVDVAKNFIKEKAPRLDVWERDCLDHEKHEHEVTRYWLRSRDENTGGEYIIYLFKS